MGRFDDAAAMRRWMVNAAIVVALVVAGVVLVRRAGDGEVTLAPATSVASSDSSAGQDGPDPIVVRPPSPGAAPSDTALPTPTTVPDPSRPTTLPATAATPSDTPATSSTTARTTTTSGSPTTVADEVAAGGPVTTDPEGGSVTTAPVGPEGAATGGTATGPGFPIAPDGSPLPIVAIFDTDTVTLTGWVPSRAAADRLLALAAANSKTPAEIVDQLIVDPDVPLDVDVRVIEMNSVRFPEGTATITPEHAAELDRVATVMNALPNTTVLVVGHADQRGSDDANFAISDERARAVVNYLRFVGIAPTRLASRAAGASDLISLGDDEAALALNRRTEFVFSGLLVE